MNHSILKARRLSTNLKLTLKHTDSHLHIVATFGTSQGLVFFTSLARIPLTIKALGTSGYGIVLAITSLLPWIILIVSSLTNLTRVAVSERLGVNDYAGAVKSIAQLRKSAFKMSVIIIVTSAIAASALPWPQILHTPSNESILAIRASILAAGVLAASATMGAIYLGVMHAQKRVALAQFLPGVAAVLSLGTTAICWVAHLSVFAFVIATTVATCAPYWIAQLLGRRDAREIKRHEKLSSSIQPGLDGDPLSDRKINGKQLLVMSGAAAPPLFSTGLDPLVLSVSIGPIAVASYGLATRLGVFVTILPSALYPLYWVRFSHLRASGNVDKIRHEYWREFKIISGGTTLLAILFLVLGPWAARIVGGGTVPIPLLLYGSISILGILAAIQTITLPILAGPKTAPKLAILVFCLIVPNEVLSYSLSRLIGPAGPVIASIVAGSLLLLACYVIYRKHPDCLILESTNNDQPPRTIEYDIA